MCKLLQRLVFVFCLSSILLFQYRLSNAQTTIVNYDFNVGTSYPTLTPVLANSITCTPTSTEAFTTFAGTASGGLAFSVNTTSGNAVAMSNSSGTNTKYFQFQLGGAALVNYISYKIYLQSQRSATGATTITLAYSTDGATYTNFGTTASPGNGTFTEAVLDLSPVTALNSAPAIYFRLLASGASGTGSLRIDNFQVQAVNNCTLPSEPLTNASSVSFPDIQCTQLTLSWANGNGSNRIVVARQGASVTGTPTDGSQYNANSVFGTGDAITTSEYVVYNGVGSSVTVTGLSRKKDYYFKIVEYNISGSCPNYLTTGVVASGSAQTLYCTLGIEIETILVDACVPGGGDSSACTSEGRNEMVLFLVGANPLNTADLTISWPNNSYLGISSQNATTDTLVAQLNATILTPCGRLIQPVGGVLPANKRVLLITSTDMCVSANSFSTLNDTLIVIFQNPGNTAGHFANNTTTALCTPNCTRTLTMTFSNPAGTFDDATYYRDTIGSSDGSAVKFSADGFATYFNNGCQAPYFPLSVSMVGLSTLGSDSVCNGDTLSLQATVTGSYKNVFWSGGNGTFSNTDSVKTIYYPVAADSNQAVLNVRVIGVCDDTVNASYTFKIVYPPTVTLTLGGNDTICGSNTVTITASGGTSYLWSTGAATDSISASATGYFTVSVTNMCGTKSDSVYITKIIPPATTIAVSDSVVFCTGDSAVLTASDAPPSASFLWSTGGTLPSITTMAAGTFSVTVSNFCGSSNASVSVTQVSPASVIISPAGTVTICSGDSALITASGTPLQTYNWSTGSLLDSIYIKLAGTYSVTATNFCGTDTDSVSLAVTSMPVAAITSGSLTICTGDSVQLTASGGTSYLWSTGSSSSSVFASQNGAYSVTVSNACGSSNASVSVTVVSPASVAISPSGTLNICPGDSALVTASGTPPQTYNWSTGSTSASIYIKLAGTYFVTATNFCGADTDSVSLIVTATAVATISSSGPLTICAGDSVQLTASGGTTFIWSTGSSSASIFASQNITYSVTATGSCGSDTESVLITVNPLPLAAIAPSGPTTFCAGDSVQLTASGGTSYVWSTGLTTSIIYAPLNGIYSVIVSNTCGSDTDSVLITVNSLPSAAIAVSGPITFCAGDSVKLTASGGTSYNWSNGLTSALIKADTSGTYIVTVTNSCGNDTESVTITVNPLPSAFITASGPTTFCAGDSVQLTASGGTSYQWSPGGPSASITVTITGVYGITVTNSCGSSSDSVLVIVNSLPAASIAAAGPTSFCAGDSVKLTASGGTSYNWSNGLTSALIKADTAGIYTVTATNTCGSDTESVTITVNPLPAAVIAVSGSTTFCAGDSVQLAASGGTSYLWSTGSSAPNIFVSLNGIYSVIVGNTCGNDTDSVLITVNSLPAAVIAASGPTTFCSGDSVQIAASGGTSYLWSTGSSSPNIYASLNGIYGVIVSNACGSDTDSVLITVNPLPVATIAASGPTTFCAGDSVKLTASGGTSYKWSAIDTFAVFTPKLTGTYIVTVTNSCGSDTESVKITVTPLPNAIIDTSGSILLCTGNTLVFHASGGTTYKWNDNTTADSLIASGAGSYYFIATNTCGSDTSDTAVVTSAIKPIVTITSGGDTVVCPGKTVVLTASGNVPLMWSNGSTQSSITVTAMGTYIVSGTNLCGTAADTVVVANSMVKAGFTPKDTAGGVPLSTTFINSSKGATSYLWDFGDGTTSTLFEPAHTYANGGIFTVKLIATDALGCKDTVLYSSITAAMDMYIPNMFSPNGDNQNDVFRVRGLEGKAKWINALIFNRWGEVIWEWNELDGGWNGSTIKGQLAQEGVYVYMINIMFKTDIEQKFTGNVTLIR